MGKAKPDKQEVFAYVALRDGYLCGTFSPTLPKRQFQKILADYAAFGCSILSAPTEEAYLQMVAGKKAWSSRATPPRSKGEE